MRKKRYENIKLNGMDFILDTSKKSRIPATFTVSGIHDVYGRCSKTKEDIWYSWSSWFMDNDGLCTISSHNSNFFTIVGYIRDNITGKRYECYITRSYNRCTECEV